MMKFACLREKNYAAIYYCHRLGASLDYGMNLSIYNNNTLNMFFCIDLGAADFDRAQLIAHKAYMYNLSNIFLVKQLFSRDVTLVLDVTEPQEIYDMLKTYTSKNLKRAEEYLTAHPEIIVID
ncbi:MGF_360-14L [African swine fever virus]|nr:MGF_360-14L [African swine fever virus]